MPYWIKTLEELHSYYGTPADTSRVKVTTQLTSGYQAHIERARFCVLATVGPEGTDCSPRGDEGPVVHIQDDRTLMLPDWKGNERIDSLRNIVRDDRVSLLFLVAGSNVAIRVNGQGKISADPELCGRYDRHGKLPRTVIVIHLREAYSQCARALIRSGLWTGGENSADLPTIGDMLKEITAGVFDGPRYDAEWPERAAQTMW